MACHGFLAVDKPLGWTSHDVVGRLRKMIGIRRVGHAGTLDPAATGVLVVGVGRATRLLNMIQGSSKGYVAHVTLGTSTDAFDIDGHLASTSPATSFPSPAAVNQAIGQFTGQIEQIPPKHSAIKQGGEPLYRLLRRGESVEVPRRTVHIHGIDVVAYTPPDLVLQIECGPGVYIRSLAVDLGATLECGAYLHHLVRTKVGPYKLSDCWSLDELDKIPPEAWSTVATSTDAGSMDTPAIVTSGRDSDAWYHGRSIMDDVSPPSSTPTVRAYTHDGVFAGLGEITQGKARRGIRPRLVIPAG